MKENWLESPNAIFHHLVFNTPIEYPLCADREQALRYLKIINSPNFYYNSFIVLAMASCWVFSKENRNKVMKVYGIVIILLYISWFFNSVSQGAAGCAPYILSKYL